MFESLARFSIRFRWLIVVAWIAGVVVVNSALPSLSSIAKANNAQFLSSSSPSLRAAELATPFQGKNASMSAIIVASIPSGRLTAGDLGDRSRGAGGARCLGCRPCSRRREVRRRAREPDARGRLGCRRPSG